MSKGIIVVDVPERCGGCRFAVNGRCVITDECIWYEIRHQEKCRKCPIRPCRIMTTEATDALSRQHVAGWMQCMTEHHMVEKGGGSDGI